MQDDKLDIASQYLVVLFDLLVEVATDHVEKYTKAMLHASAHMNPKVFTSSLESMFSVLEDNMDRDDFKAAIQSTLSSREDCKALTDTLVRIGEKFSAYLYQDEDIILSTPAWAAVESCILFARVWEAASPTDTSATIRAKLFNELGVDLNAGKPTLH